MHWKELNDTVARALDRFFSTAFFTARLTRFLERSTALPSRALCQYLLIKISLQTILVLGRSNLNLIISVLAMSKVNPAILFGGNPNRTFTPP
jgi:hypothetical protein